MSFIIEFLNCTHHSGPLRSEQCTQSSFVMSKHSQSSHVRLSAHGRLLTGQSSVDRRLGAIHPTQSCPLNLEPSTRSHRISQAALHPIASTLSYPLGEVAFVSLHCVTSTCSRPLGAIHSELSSWSHPLGAIHLEPSTQSCPLGAVQPSTQRCHCS